MKKKSEYNKVFKKFITIIETQKYRIELFRYDNVKENINIIIIVLLKKKKFNKS